MRISFFHIVWGAFGSEDRKLLALKYFLEVAVYGAIFKGGKVIQCMLWLDQLAEQCPRIQNHPRMLASSCRQHFLQIYMTSVKITPCARFKNGATIKC